MLVVVGKQAIRVGPSVTPPKDNYILDREEELEEKDSDDENTLTNTKVKEIRRQIRI